MPHQGKSTGLTISSNPFFCFLLYFRPDNFIATPPPLATLDCQLQAMGFKALVDPARRLPGIKPQNAVFRVVNALREMRDEPILPECLLNRRVLDDLDLAQQRDAVAAQKIADAGFRILPEMPCLGGVSPGGHPDRPDSFRLDLGDYANARITFLIDGRQRHDLAFRQQFFRLVDHGFFHNKPPPAFLFEHLFCMNSIAKAKAVVKRTHKLLAFLHIYIFFPI